MKFAGKTHAIVIALIALTIGIACLFWGRCAWPGAWFIRGYLGDVVVIVFIVALLRLAFARYLSVAASTVATLVLAFGLEVLQTFIHAEGAIGTALGTTFDWYDLVAYAVGALISWWLFRAALDAA